MAGRDDYQDRKDNKNEQRRARAERLRASSEAGIERSVSMLPDNGQPILVGHHSEKRHRRDLERSDNIMRKAVDDGKEAERLEQRADASESSGAISSDDPDALPKLREKLAGMEAQREKFKQYNKDARKAGKDQLPSYVLTNLGGNIRRVKLRIKELETAEKRTIYNSSLFAAHWKLASRYNAPVRILSAEHHVLDPEQRIAPYNRSVKTLRASERAAWDQAIATWLLGHVEPGGQVVVLAGQDYVRWRKIVPEIEVLEPLARLTLGDRLQLAFPKDSA